MKAAILIILLSAPEAAQTAPPAQTECQRSAARDCAITVAVSATVLGAVGMAKGAVTAVAARGPSPQVVIPAAVVGGITGAAAGAAAAIVSTCSKSTDCGKESR